MENVVYLITGAATANVLTAVKQRGLKACVVYPTGIMGLYDNNEISLPSQKSPQAMQMLGFSENYEPLICIGLGYPDETPAAKPRDMGKVKFID